MDIVFGDYFGFWVVIVGRVLVWFWGWYVCGSLVLMDMVSSDLWSLKKGIGS